MPSTSLFRPYVYSGARKPLRVGLQTFWRVFQERLARAKTFALLLAFMLIIVVSGRSAERVGDYIQVFLPVTGLFCAAAQGQGVHYFGRYLVLEVGIKGPKFMLGDAPMNQRPNGGSAGFPSGHTAAATFGAVGLMKTCLKDSAPAQVAVIMAAGFTGGSRIDADHHTVWQALAGAIWGWAVQVMALIGFDRGFRAFWNACARGLRRLRRRVARSLVVALATVGFAVPAAKAEPEISLYLGAQVAGDSTVSGTDPAGVGAFSFPASWDGRSFDSPPHYGIRATWWRTDRFGWQIDFNHTKLYADDATLAGSGFSRLEFTDGLNNLTAGPVWRWPQARRAWTPYAGFGAGVVIPHVESRSTASGPETAEYQIAGPTVAWMAGLSYALTDQWFLFGEYKGTYSWVEADLVGGGSMEFDVDTHAINFGVTYRFR